MQVPEGSQVQGGARRDQGWEAEHLGGGRPHRLVTQTPMSPGGAGLPFSIFTPESVFNRQTPTRGQQGPVLRL